MSFASMETPGPFEKVARDAYYSITLPDRSWSTDRQEQHLSFFNKYSLPLISVHEAFPGHYTQFLRVQGVSSRVRKVFGCASFSEGWAHYCEQLYADHGLPTLFRMTPFSHPPHLERALEDGRLGLTFSVPIKNPLATPVVP